MAPGTDWSVLDLHEMPVEVEEQKSSSAKSIVSKLLKAVAPKPKVEKILKWPMWPKIVQINKTDVYVLGGNDTTIETQFKMHYNVLKSNFLIVLDPVVLADPARKLTVHSKANMLRPRQAFGLCAVNNYIYVGGGVTKSNAYTWTTDRYDVINDTWENLKQCNFPEALFANSFIAIRKRFIY